MNELLAVARELVEVGGAEVAGVHESFGVGRADGPPDGGHLLVRLDADHVVVGRGKGEPEEQGAQRESEAPEARPDQEAGGADRPGQHHEGGEEDEGQRACVDVRKGGERESDGGCGGPARGGSPGAPGDEERGEGEPAGTAHGFARTVVDVREGDRGGEVEGAGHPAVGLPRPRERVGGEAGEREVEVGEDRPRHGGADEPEERGADQGVERVGGPEGAAVGVVEDALHGAGQLPGLEAQRHEPGRPQGIRKVGPGRAGHGRHRRKGGRPKKEHGQRRVSEPSQAGIGRQSVGRSAGVLHSSSSAGGGAASSAEVLPTSYG
jgi:hypothetical protein